MAGLAGNVSFQDFWEHWSGNSYADISTLIEDRKMYLSADSYELLGNDTAADAQTLVAGANQLHTLIGYSDEDWFSIDTTPGQSFSIDTLNEYNGAAVQVALYSSDGVTQLTGNSSRIDYSPADSGPYLVRLIRSPSTASFVRYGSYIIRYY
jgi:hypothetical protein